MFASLKNKIKEETGSDLPALPASRLSNSGRHHLRGRLSSSASITSIDDIQALEQKDAELTSLRLQCNELTSKVTELTTRIEDLELEKERLEKANDLLMESVKVAQTQKDLMSDEQEKIQNVQLEEITRLKSLLSFREQEAVDRLSLLKQNQQQIETLKAESDRLKMIEPMLEDIQDEAERLRHSAQLDKNNLTTTLAAIEEENRHLKSRLQIIDQSRLDIISSLSSDEKVQALVQERKLLEQHLEEAHLQLSDIKSSWSGQNLALETQVSRLSRQVAEETTEKRKSIKERDEFIEKVKQLEFDLQKVNDEILHRDNKIKLLDEEIDELSSALRECRTDSEQEVSYLKSKAESSANEIAELKSRLISADERLSEYVENSEQVTQALRKQNLNLQEQLQQANDALETEKQERLTALLRNAEISQSEEILKKELRLERDEINELNEKQAESQKEIKQKEEELARTIAKLTEVNSVIHSQSDRIAQIDNYQHEINEKNKTIKILNQRMSDLKKTLQEIKSNNFSDGSGLTGSSVISSDKIAHDYKNNGSSNGPIVMDEVNFKYLKHVIVKFLTSREVEARHLIRAVATLLQLSHEEEQLLHDTLNWKMSWFGSKPDHGTGQRAVSIPPS